MARKKASPQNSAKQLLRKFTSNARGGGRVTRQEVKRVINKTSAAPQKILNLARKSGISFAGPATKYVKRLIPKITPSPGETPGGGGATYEDDGTGIFGPISAHEANIAKIYADADKYVADAYSGAQIRSAELGLEGTKYSADKESEWRQAVANIEVKGRLDLQPIINAGLEKVANIEAQASRDVADITGKYDVEGIKTRGEFDEKIGKINLAGSMYGLIRSAFG